MEAAPYLPDKYIVGAFPVIVKADVSFAALLLNVRICDGQDPHFLSSGRDFLTTAAAAD